MGKHEGHGQPYVLLRDAELSNLLLFTMVGEQVKERAEDFLRGGRVAFAVILLTTSRNSDGLSFLQRVVKREACEGRVLLTALTQGDSNFIQYVEPIDQRGGDA